MQTTSHSLQRDLDPYQPIALSSNRYLKIHQARCRHTFDWEDNYLVEMEAVEMPNSNAFEIAVVFHWELLSDLEDTPPNIQRLFAIARQLTRDHFNNSLSARVCSQQWGIIIHYPPHEDLPEC